jgi:phosphoribosylaminoimidazole carboxylase PurK protein
VQRQRYARFGVPSPRAFPIGESWSETFEISDVIAALGYPLVIKSAFGGYDGKGTRTIRNEKDFEEHRALWEKARWFAEDYVPFKREVAVMVCRSKDQTICFPTMETIQTNHVCDLVFPANTDASDIAIRAVEAVEGYGLFGVELFELEDGTFQVNEIAPRPHNTGHYTLDWGGVSQFEAHIRLVMGLPIPEPKGQETCMANLLGIDNPGDYKEGLRAAIEGDPGVFVHWYGKAEARGGRKMGHINAVGPDAISRAKAARERFYAAWRAL